MTTIETTIRRVAGSGELLSVAWARSWEFTPVLRRDTPERQQASQRWTWQWAVVAWLAVFMLPAVLLDVAAQSSRIWILAGGASAQARPVRQQQIRRARGAAAVGVTAFIVLVGMLVAYFYAVLDLSWPLMVLAGLWLSATLVFLGARLGWPAQSKGRSLLARAQQMAGNGRQGYVVSDVVSRRRGGRLGQRLMLQLQRRWRAEGAVAVLYPGSESLVAYYRDLGWGIDEMGDGRRMVWPARDSEGDVDHVDH